MPAFQVAPAAPAALPPVAPPTPAPPPTPTQPQPATSAASSDEEVELTETMVDYIATDRKLAELNAQSKVLRAKIVTLKAQISAFMEERGIEDITTRDLRLKLRRTQVKPQLSKAALRTQVATFFGGDEDKAAQFFEQVYDARDPVERTSLCRLKLR